MAPKKTLKSLPGKSVGAKQAATLKGGARKDKLATNHNQTVRTL